MLHASWCAACGFVHEVDQLSIGGVDLEGGKHDTIDFGETHFSGVDRHAHALDCAGVPVHCLHRGGSPRCDFPSTQSYALRPCCLRHRGAPIDRGVRRLVLEFEERGQEAAANATRQEASSRSPRGHERADGALHLLHKCRRKDTLHGKLQLSRRGRTGGFGNDDSTRLARSRGASAGSPATPRRADSWRLRRV